MMKLLLLALAPALMAAGPVSSQMEPPAGTVAPKHDQPTAPELAAVMTAARRSNWGPASNYLHYAKLFIRNAARWNVDPILVACVAYAESRYTIDPKLYAKKCGNFMEGPGCNRPGPCYGRYVKRCRTVRVNKDESGMMQVMWYDSEIAKAYKLCTGKRLKGRAKDRKAQLRPPEVNVCVGAYELAFWKRWAYYGGYGRIRCKRRGTRFCVNRIQLRTEKDKRFYKRHPELKRFAWVRYYNSGSNRYIDNGYQRRIGWCIRSYRKRLAAHRRKAEESTLPAEARMVRVFAGRMFAGRKRVPAGRSAYHGRRSQQSTGDRASRERPGASDNAVGERRLQLLRCGVGVLERPQRTTAGVDRVVPDRDLGEDGGKLRPLPSQGREGLRRGQAPNADLRGPRRQRTTERRGERGAGPLPPDRRERRRWARARRKPGRWWRWWSRRIWRGLSAGRPASPSAADHDRRPRRRDPVLRSATMSQNGDKDNQRGLYFGNPTPTSSPAAGSEFDHTDLDEAFERYDAANPEVWRLFVKYTFEAIRSGRSHYSARAIAHRIRWHTQIETQSDDGYKLANAHVARYARKFRAHYPEHAGFFRTLKVKGGDHE